MPRTSRLYLARRGELVLPPGAFREATHFQRAVRAQRLAARAYRGAEIHDRLCVHRDLRVRRAPFRELPQALSPCGFGSPGLDTEEPRQHALDVAIENRMSLVATERQD